MLENIEPMKKDMEKRRQEFPKKFDTPILKYDAGILQGPVTTRSVLNTVSEKPELFMKGGDKSSNLLIPAGELSRLPGSWSSGFDVALTRRRSPVRIRPGPFRHN